MTRYLSMALWVCAALLTLAFGHNSSPPGVAVVASAPPPAIGLQLVASGLGRPVLVTHAGDGSGRRFVVDTSGRVWIVEAGGQVRTAPFLDVSAQVADQGDLGLSSIAFDPEFGATGRFYVAYSTRNGANTEVPYLNVVTRYRVLAGNPNQADPASATLLLSFADRATNHNGGMLAFGADGYLYLGTGDEGGSGDVYQNAQNLLRPFGKILRIDVNVPDNEGYRIPLSNPFTNRNDALPEIWAYGLRHPWRFSFDRATSNLYIGDVGNAAYEEVNVQQAGSPGGENYGWNRMEGLHCFAPPSGCNQDGIRLPVHEYQGTGSQGCEASITGGYVYRGDLLPGLRGSYVFGDFCTGQIWALRQEAGGAWVKYDLLSTASAFPPTGLFIAGFGEDEAGEHYVADWVGGSIYRIVAAPAPPTSTPTLVPAATPTPTQCSPRPQVVTTVVRDGPGRLRIVMTAGTTSLKPTNRLIQIQFGPGTNALIDVPGVPGGPSGSTGNFQLTLAPGASQLTFFVRRARDAGSATVPITVIDECGAWPTFVGGGPNAF